LTTKASATAVNDSGLVTPKHLAKADGMGRGSSKLPFTRLGGLAFLFPLLFPQPDTVIKKPYRIEMFGFGSLGYFVLR
jgi:hypothetical protein